MEPKILRVVNQRFMSNIKDILEAMEPKDKLPDYYDTENLICLMSTIAVEAKAVKIIIEIYEDALYVTKKLNVLLDHVAIFTGNLIRRDMNRDSIIEFHKEFHEIYERDDISEDCKIIDAITELIMKYEENKGINPIC